MMGQPQIGQLQMGQPQMGQPMMGQPMMGQPQMGQPQMGQPQMGQQVPQMQPGQGKRPSQPNYMVGLAGLQQAQQAQVGGDDVVTEENKEYKVPQGRTSEIVAAAWWGAPGYQWKTQYGADVTAKAKAELKKNKKVKASNSVFDDPAPGMKKILVIRQTPHYSQQAGAAQPQKEEKKEGWGLGGLLGAGALGLAAGAAGMYFGKDGLDGLL